MGDLISRQQAINALCDYLVGKRCPDDGTLTCRLIENEVINKLPSVQPEHCGDAVSRNAIIQKLNQMDRYVSAELRLCDTDKKFPQNEVFIVDDVYEEIVEQLPSAQPERKTGRWIPDNTDYYRTRFICSVCGESEEVPTMGFGYAPMWGYCPNCGADMRGEQDG